MTEKETRGGKRREEAARSEKSEVMKAKER